MPHCPTGGIFVGIAPCVLDDPGRNLATTFYPKKKCVDNIIAQKGYLILLPSDPDLDKQSRAIV
jgi:hypothetical protein